MQLVYSEFDLLQCNLIEKGELDHEPTFTTELIAGNLPKFHGAGKSLKEAQTKAVEFAMKYIKKFEES